ncbi:radical SAM protein, partial [Patescibacteria group bacterium]|nr:radical SAM protein [Patescibacteria group bacterium]
MDISNKIILEALKTKPQSADELNKLKRQILRLHKSDGIPNSAQLLKSYHKLLARKRVKRSKYLEHLLIKRAVRTLSGVSIITVLTKPFPCPGECVYCPNEKIMPKSYISDEPAAARALMLGFDPFEQVARRIEALENNGHPTDKIELIVKGGTWNAYPVEYQYWFILRCFEASNRKNQNAKIKMQNDNLKFKIIDLKKNIIKAQKKNETAPHRIVGLTLETRPDHITEKNIWIMRELGCTRVELGAQTTDNKILKTIKRGHDAKEIARAAKLLKRFGFKVDFHLMPQLPGSTPAKDLKMMQEIFANPDYRPDMIKIYPCTVVENSELHNWFKKGKFKPYSDRKL